MTLSPDSNLAAMIASRICHDLISPLGAIGNGVELLSLAGGELGPEVALIGESVTNANARIRFFRIAFGAAGSEARQNLGEVRSILSDLTQGGRLVIDWTSASDLTRAQVKIAFLLITCLESALPYGGRISVVETAGHWTLEASAQRFRVDPQLWAMLAEPTVAPEITAAVVHFPLAALEISRQGRRLAADLGQTAIRLSF